MDSTPGRRRRYIGKKKQRRYRRFWGEVIRNRYRSLLQRARRFTNGDESLASDLVQRVAELIFERCPKPITVKSTQAYLFATTFYCWTETKPRAEKVNVDDVVASDIQDSELVVEPRTAKNVEQTEIVEQVVKEQKWDEQEVRCLLFMKAEGRTYAEIDKALNRDPGYAQWLWSRLCVECRRKGNY